MPLDGHHPRKMRVKPTTTDRAATIDLDDELPPDLGVPRLGNHHAPIVVVLDPVISARPFNYPIKNEDMGWLAPRILEYAKLGRDDVQFLAAAPFITFEQNGKDREVTAHLKEYEAAFDAAILTLNPRLIVPMGARAARQILGKAVQITKIRGAVIEETAKFGKIPVLPVMSPFYARRHPENEALFCADIETLGRVVESGYSSAATSARNDMQISWCFDITALLKNPPELLSVDVEGVGLDPFKEETKLLTVQLTYESGKALVIPIDYDAGVNRHHRFIDWIKVCHDQGISYSDPVTNRRRSPKIQCEAHEVYRKRILQQLKTLLENPKVRCIGQNLKFDWLYLYYKADIAIANYYGDTLLMAHLLDENMLTKNIDDLTRVYIPEYSGYNDLLNRDPEHQGKSRMDLLTPDKMLRYAGGDTIVAYQLYNRLLQLLQRDTKLYSCYMNTVMRGIRGFCYVETNGFTVNVKALREFEKYLTKIQKEEKEWLLDQLPQSIKNKWRGNGVGLKPDRAVILIDYLYKHPDGLLLTPKVYTKTGIPSVSTKLAMPYYAAHYEFVRRFMEYSKNQKMLSTYVKGFYKYIVDGKIRPTFLLHNTTTGRSSCLHEDTLIPTQRGMVRIADIEYGDLVKTHKNRLRKVIRKFIKPVQDMYDVTLSNGQTIRCTEEHRFLCVTDKWESLRNVCIKTALGRYPSSAESSKSLHQLLADFDAGSTGTKSDLGYSNSYFERGFGNRTVSDIQNGEILCIENRCQQPDAWQETGQLQTGRVSRGWTWIPDNGCGRSAIFRASGCNGGSLGAASVTVTEHNGCSSYRRGYSKQRIGQLGTSDQIGTPGDTCTPVRVVSTVAITQVHHCGSYRVYDIEVEDDHSYAACGVLNHNSKNPNGQNFPKRGKMAKIFRRIFQAPKGWVYGQNDLSQAELRIASMISGDERMMQVYLDGGDIHRATAAGVMGLSIKEFLALDSTVQALERYHAKAVNFGFLYGMWWKKFKEYAKTDYGVDFTDEEAAHIREMFFETYPRLLEWHQKTEKFVRKHKFVRAFNGRIRHLPMVDSPDESIAKQAVRQAINSPVQSFASDIGLMAIGLLMPYLRKTGMDRYIKVCGFIHDSIVYLAREDKTAVAARTIRKFMENIPYKKWFGWEPTVPIIAEVELGRNLADTYECKERHYSKESGNRTFRQIEAAIIKESLPSALAKVEETRLGKSRDQYNSAISAVHEIERKLKIKLTDFGIFPADKGRFVKSKLRRVSSISEVPTNRIAFKVRKPYSNYAATTEHHDNDKAKNEQRTIRKIRRIPNAA